MTVKSYILSNYNYIDRLQVQSQNATFANNISSINVISSVNDTSKVQNITFGSNVIDIQPSCCANCTNLNSVTFLGNVRSFGDRAFFNCSTIKNINIPTSVSYVGKECFDSGTSLNTIMFPNVNVTYGEKCFHGCTSITSAIIQLNDDSGNYLFQGSTSLKIVQLSGHIITDYCFDGCSHLTDVSINKTQQINQYAFRNCTELTSIQFKGSLVSIGYAAFKNCTKFTNGDFSNTSLTSIANEIFSGTAITTLKLPTTITTLSQIPSDMLKGSSITTIYLNGFTDAYMKKNKDEFTQFGANTELVIFSKSGKKYKTYPPGKNGLRFDAVYCIIETSIAAGLTTGCSNNIKNFYNMVNAVYSSNDTTEITYETFLDANYSSKIPSGLSRKDPTKENVSNAIKNALKSDYGLVIIYLMDHGSGSSIGVTDGKISGTELKDWINAGNPETRILLVCDCCHAAGMAPFKAMKLNSQIDIVNDTQPFENIMDSLFNGLERDHQQRMMQMKSSKMLFLAVQNPEPTILGWYTCSSSHYGWMGSGGAEFLLRMVDLFNKNDTYKSFYEDKVMKTPYSYTYDSKHEVFYGYGSNQGNSTAYHIQYNYKNKFDTSLQVFT